jgi:hypothetical protein
MSSGAGSRLGAINHNPVFFRGCLSRQFIVVCVELESHDPLWVTNMEPHLAVGQY